MDREEKVWILIVVLVLGSLLVSAVAGVEMAVWVCAKRGPRCSEPLTESIAQLATAACGPFSLISPFSSLSAEDALEMLARQTARIVKMSEVCSD